MTDKEIYLKELWRINNLILDIRKEVWNLETQIRETEKEIKKSLEKTIFNMWLFLILYIPAIVGLFVWGLK